MKTITRSRTLQQGYSLAEMLVVVAIVGLISMVAVPNFISMYKNSRFKNVMRNFVTACRNTQQRAITENRRTRISFAEDGKTYKIFREMTSDTTNVTTWELVAERPLDTRGDGTTTSSFFDSTGFNDADDPDDGLNDVIFNPNGTVTMPVAPNQPVIVIKTTDAIKKPTYTVTFSLAGNIRAT
jgi:prepilin-type N-terminal cleavage/methylation domain-containing protein